MVNIVDYAIKTLEGESQPIDGVLVNHGTYLGKLLKTDSRVPGRLKCDRHGDFYRDVLETDEETVGIIRHSYKIPFNSLPPETGVVPNNKSCIGKEECVWSEMIRYTQLGCVQEVDGPSRVMLPLSVVFSNKTRLVVDASRHLNPWVKKESTKLDSLDDVGELLKPGMFVAVDDLDSGY